MGCGASARGRHKHILVQPSTISDLYHKLDVDSDSKIDTAELRTFLQNHQVDLSTEQLDAIVQVWDKNGDGVIDAREFRNAMQSVKLTQSSVPLSIVVPSTSKVSVQCTEGELATRRTEALTFLAHQFGGATAKAPHLGAYRAFDGSMVYEQGVVVESFTTPEKWVTCSEAVRQQVQQWCREWGQECIALTVLGTMEFLVAPGEHDPELLGKSVLRRIQILHQLKTVQ